MPVVKVCCIQSAEEAARAARAGASFLGLVAAMPSGPGPILDPVIAEIAAGVPHGATPVLLTSRTEGEAIAEHVRTTGARAVQIVRAVSAEERRAVREALPGVPILQVVHVEGEGSLDEALGAVEGSDYLLLDSGRPSAPVPELGGTGRVHDWSVSARIVAEVPVPVFLAGGLGPRNVARAVAEVAPFGVDVCSGLRGPDGRLDPALLAAFMEAVGAGVSAPRQP